MMNINISSRIPENKKFDAVVVAVAHEYFGKNFFMEKLIIKEKELFLISKELYLGR